LTTYNKDFDDDDGYNSGLARTSQALLIAKTHCQSTDSISAFGLLFLTTANAIYSPGHWLHTLIALPTSTQIPLVIISYWAK